MRRDRTEKIKTFMRNNKLVFSDCFQLNEMQGNFYFDTDKNGICLYEVKTGATNLPVVICKLLSGEWTVQN